MSEIKITEDIVIYNDMESGWLGKYQPRWHKKVYMMWHNMWNRCRNPNHPRYKDYKDCNIFKDFNCLSSYTDFIMSEPRFDEFTKTCDKIRWNIDKDTKDPNNRNYYPECMTLCTLSENDKERVDRCGNSFKKDIVPVIGIKDDFIILLKFVNDGSSKGFDPSTISKCLKGKYKTHKGYKWFRINYKHNKIYRIKR